MQREANASSPTGTLRRVRRLALVVLVSCLAVSATLSMSHELSGDMRLVLSLLIAVTASWAIVNEVARHQRAEKANLAANAKAARLEGARLTAEAMQDKVANKLSITVGYCEFLANDSRLPPDLQEQAEKALMGAKAAAEIMSELKRMTKSNGAAPPFLGDDPLGSTGSSDVD
jgi:hypothetical protein